MPNRGLDSARGGAAGFTLIELSLVIAVIGLIAAIKIPDFIKFQARAKQSEAKANLKGLYTAETAFFQEKDTFSPDVSKIGFKPDGHSRYKVAFTKVSLRIESTPAVLGITGTDHCVIVTTLDPTIPGPWPPTIAPDPVCTLIPGADEAQQMMFLKIAGLGAAAVAGAILDYADGADLSGETGRPTLPVTADMIRSSLARPGLVLELFAALDANHDGTVTMMEVFSYARHAPGQSAQDWVADFLAVARRQISVIADDADLGVTAFTLSKLPPALCTLTPDALGTPPCTVFPEPGASLVLFGPPAH